MHYGERKKIEKVALNDICRIRLYRVAPKRPKRPPPQNGTQLLISRRFLVFRPNGMKLRS